MNHVTVSLHVCPDCRELLELFTTSEIIKWQDLCTKYEKTLRDQTVTDEASLIFSQTEGGVRRWKDFKIRVVESVCDTVLYDRYLIVLSTHFIKRSR